jgi:hypothetical protein
MMKTTAKVLDFIAGMLLQIDPRTDTDFEGTINRAAINSGLNNDEMEMLDESLKRYSIYCYGGQCG